ncbi:tyrosine--tRNA ligase [Candidatus Pacearchaeota archaeon]|nr:tyrosine--tRNA ligase [Candidatus Pacearchaeota archaeon]
MNLEEKFKLVKRNTVEIITEEELKKLLKEKKKPSVYLGTAITGKPHLAYFAWIIKLADFLKAGFKVKVLLADIHGALDNTPWNILEERYKYYELAIKDMFSKVGMETKNVEIIKGSSFQLKKEYIMDLLKLSSFVSVHDARKSASDVVKNIEGEQAKLSGLIYPLMQALDEEHLNVDIQYGGIDQRKIFVFARENLPKVGYKPRIEVMTPLLQGLTETGKMSASISKSKVDLTDSDEEIKDKIKSAYCLEGDARNGVMDFLKYVIMVIKEDRNEKFIVKRDKKYGGDISYKNYKEIEKDFIDKKLHPQDLKNAVVEEIIKLLSKIDKKKLIKIGEVAYS